MFQLQIFLTEQDFWFLKQMIKQCFSNICRRHEDPEYQDRLAQGRGEAPVYLHALEYIKTSLKDHL